MDNKRPPNIRSTTHTRSQPSSQRSRRLFKALQDERWPHTDAVAELHLLLYGAAKFEISRRSATLPHLHGEELDDIAMQAADDALVAVLTKLDEYRGNSLFTTWAYKFAVLEAAVKLRKRTWQYREVVLDPQHWPNFVDSGESPQEQTEFHEFIEELKAAMEKTLTPHQQRIFLAVAINEIPIDVLADRLNTTRGAIYKTLHDSRKKLRAALDPTPQNALNAVNHKVTNELLSYRRDEPNNSLDSNSFTFLDRERRSQPH